MDVPDTYWDRREYQVNSTLEVANVDLLAGIDEIVIGPVTKRAYLVCEGWYSESYKGPLVRGYDGLGWIEPSGEIVLRQCPHADPELQGIWRVNAVSADEQLAVLASYSRIIVVSLASLTAKEPVFTPVHQPGYSVSRDLAFLATATSFFHGKLYVRLVDMIASYDLGNRVVPTLARANLRQTDSMHDLCHLFHLLPAGKRLIQAFGSWHGIAISILDTQSLEAVATREIRSPVAGQRIWWIHPTMSGGWVFGRDSITRTVTIHWDQRQQKQIVRVGQVERRHYGVTRDSTYERDLQRDGSERVLEAWALSYIHQMQEAEALGPDLVTRPSGLDVVLMPSRVMIGILIVANAHRSRYGATPRLPFNLLALMARAIRAAKWRADLDVAQEQVLLNLQTDSILAQYEPPPGANTDQ